MRRWAAETLIIFQSRVSNTHTHIYGHRGANIICELFTWAWRLLTVCLFALNARNSMWIVCGTCAAMLAHLRRRCAMDNINKRCFENGGEQIREGIAHHWLLFIRYLLRTMLNGNWAAMNQNEPAQNRNKQRVESLPWVCEWMWGMCDDHWMRHRQRAHVLRSKRALKLNWSNRELRLTSLNQIEINSVLCLHKIWCLSGWRRIQIQIQGNTVCTVAGRSCIGLSILISWRKPKQPDYGALALMDPVVVLMVETGCTNGEPRRHRVVFAY